MNDRHHILLADGYAAPVIVGLAAGIAFILSLVMITPSLPSTVRIQPDTIYLDDRRISIEERTDTNRIFLTDSEQRVMGIALSNPHVQRLLEHKGDLYVKRIVQGQELYDDKNEGEDCIISCAQVVIAWGEPASEVHVMVDVEKKRVEHYLFDP